MLLTQVEQIGIFPPMEGHPIVGLVGEMKTKTKTKQRRDEQAFFCTGQ
jgi:hypothetical protein